MFREQISLSRATQLRYPGTGIVVALVAAVPLFTDDTFYLHMLNIAFLILASALGWNVIFNSGQLTFGHSGFIAIGAYTSALLVLRLHFPFYLGFLLGGVLAFIVAVFLATLFSRLTGIFFVLLTFAASEAIRLLLINIPSVTHGTDGIIGIPPPVVPIVNLVIRSKAGSYWLHFIFVGLVMIFVQMLYKSPWGMTLRAVKSNLLLAECTGIDTRRFRIIAFGIGCGLAGFSGSLLAHFLTYTAPASFTWWKTVDALFANVVGGLHSMAGIFVGSVIVASLPELLRGFVAWQVALYGLVLVLVIRFLPGGLLSLVPKRQMMRRHSQNNKGVPVAGVEIRAADSGNAFIRFNKSGTERNATQGKELLLVENLSKHFGGLAAVNGVTFTLKAGEILGIIGPNGAGKTTLYNLITGVIRPSAGRVMFNGKNILGLTPHEI